MHEVEKSVIGLGQCEKTLLLMHYTVSKDLMYLSL